MESSVTLSEVSLLSSLSYNLLILTNIFESIPRLLFAATSAAIIEELFKLFM